LVKICFPLKKNAINKTVKFYIPFKKNTLNIMFVKNGAGEKIQLSKHSKESKLKLSFESGFRIIVTET